MVHGYATPLRDDSSHPTKDIATRTHPVCALITSYQQEIRILLAGTSVHPSARSTGKSVFGCTESQATRKV
jgi:hypothetical protein